MTWLDQLHQDGVDFSHNQLVETTVDDIQVLLSKTTADTIRLTLATATGDSDARSIAHIFAVHLITYGPRCLYKRVDEQPRGKQ
jgi:hypothetical protein